MAQGIGSKARTTRVLLMVGPLLVCASVAVMIVMRLPPPSSGPDKLPSRESVAQSDTISADPPQRIQLDESPILPSGPANIVDALLYGKAEDVDGLGCLGVTVRAKTSANDAQSVPLHLPSVLSQLDGAFEWRLLPEQSNRRFDLCASNERLAGFISNAKAGEAIRIVMRPSRMIRVDVASSRGEKIPDVLVYMYYEDTRSPVWSTMTDQYGSTGNLAAPTGDLRLLLRHHKFAEHAIAVRAGNDAKVVSVVLNDAAARVVGTVLDRDTHLPISGVRVCAAVSPDLLVLSNADGRFELGISTEETRPRLRIDHPDYLACVVEATCEEPARPLVIRMRRGGELALKVVDDQGAPVSGASIEAHSHVNRDRLPWVSCRNGITDHAGRVVIKGTPRRVTVVGRGPGNSFGYLYVGSTDDETTLVLRTRVEIEIKLRASRRISDALWGETSIAIEPRTVAPGLVYDMIVPTIASLTPSVLTYRMVCLPGLATIVVSRSNQWEMRAEVDIMGAGLDIVLPESAVAFSVSDSITGTQVRVTATDGSFTAQATVDSSGSAIVELVAGRRYVVSLEGAAAGARCQVQSNPDSIEIDVR